MVYSLGVWRRRVKGLGFICVGLGDSINLW